jgi:hypothetical protein
MAGSPQRGFLNNVHSAGSAFSDGRLGALGAILGSPLTAFGNTNRIESPSYHMEPHSREVAYSPATYQNYGVLLQVMSFAWYITRYLFTISKPDTSYLAKS